MPFRLPLLAVLLVTACGSPSPTTDDTDSPSDTDTTADTDASVTLTDPVSGVSLEIPAGALPAGISPDDVTITVDSPEGLPDALGFGLTPIVTLEPAGTELTGSVMLSLPVSAPPHASVAPDSQIIDAISANNVKALGEAPAMAIGSLDPQHTSVMFLNAVNAQQQQNYLSMAATSQGVALLHDYSVLVPGTRPPIDQLTRIAPPPSQGSPQIGVIGGWKVVEGRVRVETRIHTLGTYALVDLEIDRDHNGIHDILEGPDDLDGDGWWNFEDWDDDGDHVADETEGLSDDDNDLIPAFHDDDSNGDGTLDGVPSCVGGSCACALRDALGVRLVCSEDTAITCEDHESELGTAVYEEIPGGACPQDLTTAVCLDATTHDVSFYGEQQGLGYDVFCDLCASALSPGDYCP